MLSVVIPCAGEGSRLGLPYPKELHCIDETGSLIDNSINLLVPHSQMISHVNVVIRKGKEEVLFYLQHKWGRHFSFVGHMFDDRYHEWPGSIRSAAAGFSENNLVLLPDSVITEQVGNHIVPTVDRLLSSKNEIVFGYLKEQGDRLHSLGALNVQGEQVLELEDKPLGDIEKFNAFWGCFAFSKSIAEPLLNFMTENVRKKQFGLSSVSSKCAGFPLKNYRDLGTWASIKELNRVKGK